MKFWAERTFSWLSRLSTVETTSSLTSSAPVPASFSLTASVGRLCILCISRQSLSGGYWRLLLRRRCLIRWGLTVVRPFFLVVVVVGAVWLEF